jgi:hypothetical protein
MDVLPRHQCLIYEGDPSKHLRYVARAVIQRLKSNNRCLYLNSPAMVAGIRSALAAAGLDLPAEIEKGALVLSSDQGHLVNGQFDIDRMIGILGDAVRAAVADGYAGFWATGDMTWQFGSEENLSQLLEYERKLEELIEQNSGLSGICQYHRDTLPQDAIQTALVTHKALYINETLMRLNPQYRYPLTAGLLGTNLFRTEDR